MVRVVPTSATERALNRATAWIPAPLRSYAIALAALLLLSAVAYPIVHGAPRGSMGLLGVAITLLFLLVLLGSSWLGYGAGIMTWTLVLFLPRALGLVQRPSADPFRFALLLLVSLLISRIAATGRRREAELTHAAEELEVRVEERTAEALRSAQTARDAAEDLREQAQLLDLAHDGILSHDWNGTIRFWNRGAERMYGWTREEALGQVSHSLLKTVFPEAIEEIRKRSVADGHWEGELTHTRKDGTQLKVSSRWAVRKGGDGRPAGYLEINTDITERLRIEEQLRHTQKLESLGVLAGGVAHDFNNLLTGILGNASLALDNIGPSHPNRPLIEEVMKAAERAAELTRQLLAYAGKGRFVMRTLDLSDLVREISGLVQASLPKRANLRLQLAERLPGIDADPGQLQQIIMNLVINGAEAIMAPGGSVLVQTALQEVDQHYISTMSSAGELLRPGFYVALEVHDTGSGMDEETLSRIFDPFFSTKFAGRGLGLSAVLGIVRAHKGALKVYSMPGQGTTFKVLFPASAGVVATAAEPAAKDLRGAGTVLIVDDEEIVRSTAKHTLLRYGYQSIAAQDGVEALEAYKNRIGKVVLVLLDLTMPVMSGEETLRHLQLMDPEVKVLLTSGYNELEAVQRFAGKGLAGFIQKPYTAAALAEKVKEVLAG
jgi:two-component system, cell cycle sensor histidine kinase and response regulator CckA